MVAVITVLLADDNLIVREGVRAMLARESDLEVVAVAADQDELLAEAERTTPQVVVTDIRMPPDFNREGIEAAQLVRKRYPGTGVVILSQYDDPGYAVSLLASGSAGYGYLLKQHVADGDQLARAVRAVATGGTSLDPMIVDALMRPVRDDSLSDADAELLEMVASGRPIKAIAAARRVPPQAAEADVERLFGILAADAAAGRSQGLDRLRMLHHAIVEREEQGESLSRMLPSGLADKLRAGGVATAESELVEVTVLMSDIRGYSAIAESTPPALLARQLNEHRAAMNRAILDVDGTVMQFVGDAVMATFGAPFPQADHAQRAVRAAGGMHRAQQQINARWRAEGLPEFPIGVGLSTGEAAAALLGSDEHFEYTLVGDTVNLAQRLQQWAAAGETALSEATWSVLDPKPTARELPPATVKGRSAAVRAWIVPSEDDDMVSVGIEPNQEDGS
jgi:class 3 adenylate cyclase/DNA-binding NarL/FixJ family response regulator